MVALLTVAAAAPSAALAAYPGTNGRIAYTGGPGSEFDLFTVLPDGTGTHQLTNTGVTELDPAWSADGSRLAFVRQGALFTIRADGMHERQVTHEVMSDAEPEFSPNGGRIVYSRDNLPVADFTHPRRVSIFTIRSDGTDKRQIVASNSATFPEYSPDGTKIVFAGAPLHRPHGIWTVRPNRSQLERLTTNSAKTAYYDGFPDWSPDGRHIIFRRCDKEISQGVCYGNVLQMRPDGSDKRLLVRGTYGNYRAVVSPDGSRIALGNYSASNDCTDVTTVSRHGASPFDVTDFCDATPTGNAAFPSWQPLP